MRKSHISPAHSDYSWNEQRIAEAVLRSSYIPRVAAYLPSREAGLAGRPAEYPDIVYVLFTVLTSTFGSQRKAASWLAEAGNWYRVRRQAERPWGITLPNFAPTRSTCGYNFRRLADKHHVLFRDAFRALAIEQANNQGFLMNNAVTMHKPERKDIIIGDGTVPKCRFRSKTYERLQKEGKSVPVAERYREGGEDGQWVQGKKELIFSVRADDSPNSRVLLGTFAGPKTTYGGEAGLAVEEALRFKQEIPGFLGFRFDGAFKGTHINELVKAGLSVVTPVPKDDKTRIMYEVNCANKHTHTLYSSKGEFCEGEMLDTGEVFVKPLKRVSHAHNAPRGKDGNFRAYTVLELSCGAHHRERLDNTAEGHKTGIQPLSTLASASARERLLQGHLRIPCRHREHKQQLGLWTIPSAHDR